MRKQYLSLALVGFLGASASLVPAPNSQISGQSSSGQSCFQKETICQKNCNTAANNNAIAGAIGAVMSKGRNNFTPTNFKGCMDRCSNNYAACEQRKQNLLNEQAANNEQARLQALIAGRAPDSRVACESGEGSAYIYAAREILIWDFSDKTVYRSTAGSRRLHSAPPSQAILYFDGESVDGSLNRATGTMRFDTIMVNCVKADASTFKF